MNTSKGNILKIVLLIIITFHLFLQIIGGVLEGVELMVVFWILINIVPIIILINRHKQEAQKFFKISILTSIYILFLILIAFSRIFFYSLENFYEGYHQLFIKSYFILIPFQLVIWALYLKPNSILNSNRVVGKKGKREHFMVGQLHVKDSITHENAHSKDEEKLSISQEDLSRLEKLIQKNKLDEALELFILIIPQEDIDIRNKAILVNQNYRQIKQDQMKNLISYEEYLRGISKVSNSVLNLVSLHRGKSSVQKK